MQERENVRCSNRGSGQGEPGPTGKAFLRWCSKFRARHPESPIIPLRLQEQYWLRAAAETGNKESLSISNAVRKNKGLKPFRG